MTDKPNFGPYSEWDSVNVFSEISQNAHSLFDQVIVENWSQVTQPVDHLFLRMAYKAKTTSLAIRLINSWALNLPAIALTRVRLEQLIVCSYLIHEDQTSGLERFVKHIPIGHYNAAKAAMSDPTIADKLTALNLESMREEARRAQLNLSNEPSHNEDRFERKWTQLDLRAMAKRRDVIVIDSAYVLKQSLEREYVTIYKQASSVVHAECSSLSYAYLDFFRSPSGTPVLMAVPSWALIVAATTAHYDVLQCYEILKFLNVPERGHVDLMKRWIQARDLYVREHDG